MENHEVFESRDVKLYKENLPFKDVIVGSSGENHNESNDNYLEKMRYMDADFGGFNEQGEFSTITGHPYHSS